MKHHEDHTIVLALILSAMVIVLMGLAIVVGYAFYLSVRNMGTTIEAVQTTCDSRQLVIEGCDIHGDNCAPIYMCGGSDED